MTTAPSAPGPAAAAPITADDLAWWNELAREVEWTWAKTYADTAPHDYVVVGRTRGLTKEDFVRAARVIHTFGTPGKYYGITNIYLTSDDGAVKWWTMDHDVTVTNLINRATTERLYGVQNAPDTVSTLTTPYDTVATAYDTQNPTSDEFASALRDAVASVRGPYTPAVLDLACGTGRVLDLEITTPDRYAGVDASQPMLNQLVRKHPGVARLYPTTMEQAFAQGVFTPKQFEIVTLLVSDADDINDTWIRAARALASRALIHAVDDLIRVEPV